MSKILTVVGARPQFVKAAVVSREMLKHQDCFQEVIVHTGQHYDANMSQVFFDEMQIPQPDYHLEIGGGNHGEMTGKMLIKIEEVLLKEKPDIVLVYGDTNSTLAGALAAVKLHVPVAHVEAGLRSYNRVMPEEHNRVLTDHVSDWLFCPTQTAVNNLLSEGFSANGQRTTDNGQRSSQPKVVMTGDVMLDAFLFYSKISDQKSAIIKDLQLENKDFVLCTIHRAENTDNPDRLDSILSALKEISEEKTIVLPLHPRTKKILEHRALNTEHRALKIIDPVSYFDMIQLLKHSQLVMTDSGGVQKEAFFAKSPCVTLREETEWVELVDQGHNKVVGSQKDTIISGYHEMLTCKADFDKNLYGTGSAGFKIIENLS
jgi:UDP-GlcNAc3NAcA epimerase